MNSGQPTSRGPDRLPVDTAILLPTCDAYAPLAAFTLERLDAWWPGHPDVYVCGLAAARFPFERCLPCTVDPSDWIGSTLEAVAALHERGCEWLYLILDDHPPFGPCNSDYLNRRLPKNARALNAIQVNLLGWDQFQPQEGRTLGGENLFWQCNSPGFPWKFSLHPGYWHVLTLRAMLATMRKVSPEARSARAFENRMDGVCRTGDPQLLERTYRVRGDGFAAGRRWQESRAGRALAKPAIHLARLAAGAAGAARLSRLDAALLPYLRYLNGPYPMFWSGLVRQGRLHEEALRFLAWSGHRDLADAVRARYRPSP